MMMAEPVIPRALSTDQEDPLYRDDYMAVASELIILLDGVEQRQVSTYDMDEGYVVRAVLDSHGNVQINPDALDEVWVEKVHGAVTVTHQKREHLIVHQIGVKS